MASPTCTGESYLALDHYHLIYEGSEPIDNGPHWLARHLGPGEALTTGRIVEDSGVYSWVRTRTDGTVVMPYYTEQQNGIDVLKLRPLGEGWFGASLQSVAAHGAHISQHGMDLWTTMGFHPNLPTAFSTGFAQYYGSRLNQSLLAAPGPGTFLNPATTIGESSFALIPAGEGDRSTDWNGIVRETVGGLVDLATGAPLHKFEDLSLPVGNTEFRLTRTRSAYAAAPGSRIHNIQESDAWWDWAGSGWMVSENPFLVIDSAVPGVVGNGPRTTWFIPDAHHAIPFQLIESNGTYEAPPRFRARLEHNGIGWEPRYDIDGDGTLDVRWWTTPPTQYTVSLYEGALTYTFVVVREDVPSVLFEPEYAEFGPNQVSQVTDPILSSLHHRPYLREQFRAAEIATNDREDWVPSVTWNTINAETQDGLSAVSHNPGLGMPHYGLCVEINDRRGHRVKIEYCDSHEVYLRGTSNQVEVYEASQGKGQIKRVLVQHLVPGTTDQYETDWTLLYAHRRFLGREGLSDSPTDPGWDGQVHTQTEAGSGYGSGLTQEEETHICSVAPDGDMEQFYNAEPASSDFWTRHGFTAIDRIYVFDGDVPATAGYELTVPHTDPYTLPSGEVHPDGGMDALKAASQTLWEQWRYQVRYHYAHKTEVGPELGITERVPTLVKSTVYDRPVGNTPGDVTFDRADQRVFHYRHPASQFNDHVNGQDVDQPSLVPHLEFAGMPWLVGMWDAESISQILADPDIPISNVDELFYWMRSGESDPIHRRAAFKDTTYPGSTQTVLDVLQNKSEFWSLNLVFDDDWHDVGLYDSADQSASAPGSAMAPNVKSLIVGGYLLQEPDRLFAASPTYMNRVVRAISFHDPEEGLRHVRVHRLVHGERREPISSSEVIGEIRAEAWDGTAGGVVSDLLWDRSAYLHPFPWRAGHERLWEVSFAQSYRDSLYDKLAQPGELAEARWISIIEDFESRASMLSTQDLYAQADSVKPGQLDRRIIELNPAGFKLRDRQWRYLPSGTVEEGAGLGEEFVYQTAGAYFDGLQGQLDPSNPGPGDMPGDFGLESDGTDEMELVRNELLLLERRTVGWSAGKYLSGTDTDTCGTNLNEDRFENGLVEFYEYDVFGTADVPWSQRVHLSARGIKRGQAYERGWQLFAGGQAWESTDCRPAYGEVESFIIRPYTGTGGTNPPRLYTQQYFRDVDRPASVTSHVNFLTPITALPSVPPLPMNDPGLGNETESAVHYVELFDASNPDAPSSVVRVDAGVRPGQDQPLHFEVRREIYDPDGALKFSAEAFLPTVCFAQDADGRLTVNPNAASATDSGGERLYPHASLTLTYYVRDGIGRTLASVMDAGPGLSFDYRVADGGTASVSIPVLPADYGDWAPIGSPGSTPLNYVTSFVYDAETEALADMYTHDGTRWSSRYVRIDPDPNDNDDSDVFLREFVFDGLVELAGGSTGEYIATKAGEVRDYPAGMLVPGEGKPTNVRKGLYVVDSSAEELVALTVRPDDLTLASAAEAPDVTCETDEDCSSPNFRLFAVARGKPDANGRIQNATLLEPDSTGALRAVGTKEVNDLGAVFRQNEIDGTVTRLTRNPLGHVLRRYVGTVDDDWLDVEPPYGGGPWTPPVDPDYDMALLSRTVYGSGLNDAWLPTETRLYFDNPSWATDHHGAVAENEPDDPSHLTVTTYDWRRRAVRTDRYSTPYVDSATRLATTLRFYDHVDRPVFEVDFGEGPLPAQLPAHADPAELLDDDPVPTAAQLLTLGLAPRTLREMVYGIDTEPIEVRDYDPLSGSSPAFLATTAFRGRGGETVYEQSPSSPVMLRFLDGLGRVAQEISAEPGTGINGIAPVELSRTDYVYDAAGNIIDARSFERVVDAASSADSLGDSNAVRTRVVSWYDSQRRLTASADLGTEQTGYVAGAVPGEFNRGTSTEPAWDPQQPDVVERFQLPVHARLRLNRYSLLSGDLQYAIDEAGVVTKYEYSEAGRLESMTVNPWLGQGSEPAGHESTQTRYEYKWGRKVLTATDRRGLHTNPADDQITVVKYGADIVNDQFDVVSRNNGFIGEVRISRSDAELDWFRRFDDPQNEDVDGDGYLDPVNEDFDGDGILRLEADDSATYEPDDGDRIWEPILADLDGDGVYDIGGDFDGDGIPDAPEDRDGDGFPDRGEDIDGSGTLDTAEPDLDFDGVLDPVEDLDGDGFRDVDEDLNGDGVLQTWEDLDGDLWLDVAEDLDGDGQLDGILGSDALAEDADGDGYLDDFTNRIPDTLIRYNFAGQIAERVDARGISFRYSYDGIDRLSRIQVGYYTPWAFVDIGDPTLHPDWIVQQQYNEGYPSDHWDGVVPDREEIVRVDFSYSTDISNNPIETVTAQTLVGSSYLTVSTVVRQFDAYGRLGHEVQTLGTAGPTRRVTYGWSYAPTDVTTTGHHRLVSMIYPGATGVEKTLQVKYGATPGSIEDRFSRRSGVDLSVGGAVVKSLVSRSFTGSGRLASREFGGGEIIQSFEENGVIGLPGLDTFGAPSVLHYTNANTDQLFKAEYEYDVRGNVEAVLQSFEGGPPSPPDPTGYPWQQDRLYDYDFLNRLVRSEFGAAVLDAGTGSWMDPRQIEATLERRLDDWRLDRVGNWAGGESLADLNNDDILDLSDISTFLQWHIVSDPRADLVDPFGVFDLSDINAFVAAHSGGNPPGRSTILYDSSNVQVDSRQHYDDVSGLNEIEFSRTFNASTGGGNSTTTNAAYAHDAAGNMTADGHYFYQYDAWGRLVQVNKAIDDPANPGSLIPEDDALRLYVYDGLGRLVRTKKLVDTVPTASYTVEEYVYDGVSRIQTYAGPEGPSAPPLDREYVWGDGGVDDLLCFFDHHFGGASADPDQPWYVIHDLSGDTVAVCDTTTTSASVAKSFFYEPYGDVTLAETHSASPDLDIGHKGLFHDRLDADLTGTPSPSLVPFAHIVYHNRNRVYVPAKGRFLQKDPNGSAQAVLQGGSMGGVAALPSLAFGIDTMYADGTNLYQYTRSNPIRYRDPFGLSSEDPFDIVDDFVAESVGARAAFLERIVGGARTAAYVGATIASLMPFPVTSTLADLGASALEGDMPPELVMARKVVGFATLGGMARLVGKLSYQASKYAVKYVKQYGFRGMYGAVRNSNVGLAIKADDFVTRKRATGQIACGCFTAGTLVWTSAGAVPIEKIEADDPAIHVIAAPDGYPSDSGGSEWAWPNAVSETVEISDAAVTFLHVKLADGSSEIFETTDEHPFWVSGRGWTRAELLNPGDRLSTLNKSNEATVDSVRFSDIRARVHNLSIGRTPTFFVGRSGVWVHNCFEDFNSLDDAIGPSVIQDGAKIVDRAPTKNPIHIADGYTETIYATDDYGVQWTVHHNPTTGKYRSSHESSSNNAFSD